MTKTKRKEEKKSNLKALGYATGSVYIGQNAIRSGLPRVAGVRLESHTTSRKNAKEILKNGGWLDPNKSGTGATGSLANELFADKAKQSKGKVFITGRHPDSIATNPVRDRLEGVKLRKGYRVSSDFTPAEWKTNGEINLKAYKANLDAQEVFSQALQNNPEGVKRAQEALKASTQELKTVQKSVSGKSLNRKVLVGQVPFMDHLKGRSLYVGGSDSYFRNNFVPDVDIPTAMMSDQKVKVYGNRFKATAATIKKEGLVNLMKANKGRVAAGTALTIGGLGAAGYMAKKALDNIGPVRVKSFVRKGKRVKSHIRKEK